MLRPLLLSLLLLAAPGGAAPARAQDALASGLGLMTEAARLFEAGAREEAAFRFYLGQLRARAALAADPGADPSGGPAAFSALMATLGPPINAWAFGDVEALAATIDRVLAHDAANPDPSIPAGPYEETRAGLMAMRDRILAEAGAIRAQRAANGLENR